jgi:hypothetical protein
MNYEEAKQTALDVMSDFPEKIDVTLSSQEGKSYVQITYNKSSKGKRDADMTICDEGWIVYNLWYEDLTLKPVRGIPEYSALIKIERGQLYEFLSRQIELTSRISE